MRWRSFGFATGAARRHHSILPRQRQVGTIKKIKNARLADTRWVERFGQPRQIQVESYGRLTSLRVWYAGGLEMEYGITDQDWAALSPDPGTRWVVAGGFRVLFERTPLLSLLLKEITRGK